MAKTETAPVETVTVGDETLELTPQRALTFLRAAGTVRPIRAALAAVGYDAAEHKRGWTLLHAVAGYDEAPVATEFDGEVIAAVNALDSLDESLFALVSATFKHRQPAVRDALLQGLAPGRGAASVLFVRQLLARIDKLSKKADRSVMELLARRGITPARRAELAALVATAERYTEVAPAAANVVDDTAHLEKLRALRAWYEEWSEIARTQVARKDYLLRLGLARRRRASKTPGGGTPAA